MCGRQRPGGCGAPRRKDNVITVLYVFIKSPYISILETLISDCDDILIVPVVFQGVEMFLGIKRAVTFL